MGHRNQQFQMAMLTCLVILLFKAFCFVSDLITNLPKYTLTFLRSLRWPKITRQDLNVIARIKREWSDASIEARLGYSAGIALFAFICTGIITC